MPWSISSEVGGSTSSHGNYIRYASELANGSLVGYRNYSVCAGVDEYPTCAHSLAAGSSAGRGFGAGVYPELAYHCRDVDRDGPRSCASGSSVVSGPASRRRWRAGLLPSGGYSNCACDLCSLGGWHVSSSFAWDKGSTPAILRCPHRALSLGAHERRTSYATTSDSPAHSPPRGRGGLFRFFTVVPVGICLICMAIGNEPGGPMFFPIFVLVVIQSASCNYNHRG